MVPLLAGGVSLGCAAGFESRMSGDGNSEISAGLAAGSAKVRRYTAMTVTNYAGNRSEYG
jgi:hypothetical protein